MMNSKELQKRPKITTSRESTRRRKRKSCWRTVLLKKQGKKKRKKVPIMGQRKTPRKNSLCEQKKKIGSYCCHHKNTISFFSIAHNPKLLERTYNPCFFHLKILFFSSPAQSKYLSFQQRNSYNDRKILEINKKGYMQMLKNK